MNSQVDKLMTAYFEAKTIAQKKKALEEIKNVGGQQTVNLVLWLESTSKGKNNATR